MNISLIGRAPAFLRSVELAQRAGPTDANVLLLGETGTGKELFARLVHQCSKRAGPFVAVNCGALVDTLATSELFGHRRGAFTGALSDRPGVFQCAEGGTLFLDELGEMPSPLQPHLLRALETRLIRPVGATQEIPTDIRVIAATNRLNTGQVGSPLREDLYHRIATIEIELPPLRARREDIPLLIEHFLQELAPKTGTKSIPPALIRTASAHPWPGNVRELRAAVRRAAWLSGPVIDAQLLLPRRLVEHHDEGGAELPFDHIMRDAVRRAYVRHGSIRRAARALDMPKSTFADHVKRWGITSPTASSP